MIYCIVFEKGLEEFFSGFITGICLGLLYLGFDLLDVGLFRFTLWGERS